LRESGKRRPATPPGQLAEVMGQLSLREAKAPKKGEEEAAQAVMDVLAEADLGKGPEARVPKAPPSPKGAHSPKAVTGVSDSHKPHPWHLCTNLISRARKEIPYFGNSAPAIINTLKKLEVEGVITWDGMSVDDVFDALNEYAHKKANERAARSAQQDIEDLFGPEEV